MTPAIKICGMRETGNITAVAEFIPDLMGFIFYSGSRRFAGEMLNPEVVSNLPAGIRKTGVFVNADFNEIRDTVSKYSLNVVQLHGDEPPALCRLIKDTGIQVIKAFNVGKNMMFPFCKDYTACTDYFLFDTMTINHGGSGQKFDWKLLERYETGHPFFLSGGISPSDIDNIAGITNPSFYGLDLNSRFEIKPGLKDIEKLKKFVNELRNKYKLL
jgi:phosphoribosylanthranilate isomerase